MIMHGPDADYFLDVRSAQEGPLAEELQALW